MNDSAAGSKCTTSIVRNTNEATRSFRIHCAHWQDSVGYFNLTARSALEAVLLTIPRYFSVTARKSTGGVAPRRNLYTKTTTVEKTVTDESPTESPSAASRRRNREEYLKLNREERFKLPRSLMPDPQLSNFCESCGHPLGVAAGGEVPRAMTEPVWQQPVDPARFDPTLDLMSWDE